MSLPSCEICQAKDASIWICLQHQGHTEQHHVCLDCVERITTGALAQFFESHHLDFSVLKNALQELQRRDEPDPEEAATLQKLQAMMGDDAEWGEFPGDEMEPNVIAPKTELPERCPHCLTSWQDIREDGLVGCPHCYTVFARELENVANELHHSTTHIGKVPRFRQRQERQKEVRQKRQQHRQEMLQRRLEVALQAERYEEAAQIRDKISQVSQKQL